MICRYVQCGLLLVLLGLCTACGAAQRNDGGEGLLPRGRLVPDLSSQDHKGQKLSLQAMKGQQILIYFYPKDGTPGCTKEACAIRDAWEGYAKASVRVIGVSGDDAASHREFAEEHELPFSLVADPERAWADAFGVSSFMGMMSRVSFLIDEEGRVAKIYKDVDPGVHAAQVLKDAARLKRP